MIRSRTLNRRLALLASALMLAPTNALAGSTPPPFQGVAPAAGGATISRPNGNTLNINQSTQSAIYNSPSLNIYSQQTVNVFQPGNLSNALFRCVACPTASTIDGTLWSNGRVFLVNPSGFLFGSGASINVSGLLATTHDITNANFMAGNYQFNIPGQPNASIVNLGNINITPSSTGFAALVAPGVRNAGVITANLGNVTLAAGNGFTLDFYGDKLITLQVGDEIANKVVDVATGHTLHSLVKNEGTIQANGGQVVLTAAAARHVVDSVINNKGTIEANSVGMKNGMIVLGAATAATKTTHAKQTVKVSGTLKAAGQNAGEKGGTIQITGENIKLAGAKLDASGQAGGGTVLVGGDTGGGHVNPAVAGISQAQLQPWSVATASTVSIDAATVIDASAKVNGDGGKVVVWSDQSTRFAGTILATGGLNGGNGGFAEVSSRGMLNYTGMTDLRAPNGNAGTLLLDPRNVLICDDCDGQTIDSEHLSAQLVNQNVVITTGTGEGPGNITVADFVSWSSGHSLTLSAFNSINVNALISTKGGSVTLRADNTGTGTGTVNFGDGGSVFATGGTTIFYNPSGNNNATVNTTSYQNQADYSSNVAGGSLTTYMLVNTVSDLQNIRNNLNGIYALGRDIDASVTATWNDKHGFVPIGQMGNGFTGTLNGERHTIDGLTIAPVDRSITNIGLFGVNAGTIKNLRLTNAAISANPFATVATQYVGTVAGQNFGTISHVSATGTVDGGNLAGVAAGGLVGQNGVRQSLHIGDDEHEGPSPGIPGVIRHSSADVAVTVLGSGNFCNDSCAGPGWNYAGGLVGINGGIINHGTAHGDVTVGSQAFAGGLVGQNANFAQDTSFIPLIKNSFANGDVTSAGVNIALGGLVGANGIGGFNGDTVTVTAKIVDSRSMGDVTATANVDGGVSVGGLVGQNSGLIRGHAPSNHGDNVALDEAPHLGMHCGAGSTCAGGTVIGGAGAQVGGLVGFNEGRIKYAFATGDVHVGTNGVAGGLVGFNTGTLRYTFAASQITGDAGSGTSRDGGPRATVLGGLVGENLGVIRNSFAIGNVGSLNVNQLEVGGLVGENSGRIRDSFALGNVMAGNQSAAGGLVANNNSSDFNCNGCDQGIGQNNDALIRRAYSAGTVTVGTESLAGGLVATNNGTIRRSLSFSNVTGGQDSIIGGFVGFTDVASVIKRSTAFGAVTSTGPNSIAGGFAGVNGGQIIKSYAFSGVAGSQMIDSYAGAGVFDGHAFGGVNGTFNSYLGGFAGINVGSIQDSHAFGNVTGSGGGNVVGGFVGLNAGMIDPSTSSGTVSSGPNSTVGNFAGINAPFSNLPPNSIDFPDSGSNQPGSQVGSTNVNGNPGLPSIVPPCGAATCQILIAGLGSGGGTPDNPNSGPSVDQPPPPNQQVVPPSDPNAGTVLQVNFTSGGPTGPASGGGNGGNNGGAKPNYGPAPGPGLGRTIDEQQYSGVPPPNETRFRRGEVVIQVVDTVPVNDVVNTATGLGLVLISTQHLDNANRNVFRFRVTGDRDYRKFIARLEKVNIFASTQPNYNFVTAQSAAAPTLSPPATVPASPPATTDQTVPPPSEAPDLANADTAALTSLPAGDAAQYVIDKFHLGAVHRLSSGRNVTIAVVDSEIDVTHPDLRGVIIDRFDATQTPSKPHSHGTGMAGAIASRFRLLGVAPGVRIIAIKAFDESATSAEATSYQILKGLDYAIAKKVRIINMSFAGPRDPMMERTLKTAHDAGIILIAAAGNAGPKSPPLYPGADPSVIAVSATDFNDKPFTMANRGKYIAVAAPGVDVMVPAPANGYQLTTGTSVAAAHVSGVAALLVERKPGITPDEVRAIMMKTATAFSSKPKGEEDGAGLVDPAGALQALAAGAKTSEVVPSPGTARATVH